MRPNILIFMTDQEQGTVVHPDHPCLTPNADRLAREGIRFGNAFCPAAHCCPSRTTFMTGLYPSRHGVYNNVSTPTAFHSGASDGLVMFSQLLAQSGYKMAFAGKWHVSSTENPVDRGWEELAITADKHARMQHTLAEWRAQSQQPESPRRRGQVTRPGWGNYTLFDSYDSPALHGYEDNGDYPVVQSAIEALPRLAAGEQPWCLFIGTYGPHDPFIVPRQFVDMYRLEDIPLPANFHDDLADKPAVYRCMRQQLWDQFSEDETRDAIRHYWAYCSLVDRLFGDVLAALEQTGQAEDTLVLRLSDHGDYCGAHGLYLKGVPAFREAYHIPVIMRWPRGITQPGRVVDDFITLADCMPTLLDIAECAAPAYPLTGRSLVPFLRGEQVADWDNTVCTQFNGVELYYTQRAVITPDYKYVYNGFDFDELYDLRRDPHELTNLDRDPQYAAVKHELVRTMWRFAACEQDELIFNAYGTVALAPYGPADALTALTPP